MQDLADFLKLNRSTYSNYENNLRDVPVEVLAGIAEFYHTSVDYLIGRTDDMIKVKGVNIFPGQIDDILKEAEGVSSEYQVMIDHLNGRDIMTLFVEGE